MAIEKERIQFARRRDIFTDVSEILARSSFSRDVYGVWMVTEGDLGVTEQSQERHDGWIHVDVNVGKRNCEF